MKTKAVIQKDVEYFTCEVLTPPNKHNTNECHKCAKVMINTLP